MKKSYLFFCIGVLILLQAGLTDSQALSRTKQDSLYSKAAISHYHEGMARQMSMDLDGAIEEYKAAIAIDQNMLEAWSILGMVYHAQGNFVKENEALARAKVLSKKKAAELNRRAEELFSENKIADATELWRQAEILDPELDLTSADHRLECITGAKAKW
jgi:tetratricopeptide (TPR) repeat protein